MIVCYVGLQNATHIYYIYSFYISYFYLYTFKFQLPWVMYCTYVCMYSGPIYNHTDRSTLLRCVNPLVFIPIQYPLSLRNSEQDTIHHDHILARRHEHAVRTKIEDFKHYSQLRSTTVNNGLWESETRMTTVYKACLQLATFKFFTSFSESWLWGCNRRSRHVMACFSAAGRFAMLGILSDLSMIGSDEYYY